MTGLGVADSALKLMDRMLEYKILKIPTKYKEKLYKLKKELLEAENRPDEKRIDGTIDDINDRIAILLDTFSEEIRTAPVRKKNL